MDDAQYWKQRALRQRELAARASTLLAMAKHEELAAALEARAAKPKAEQSTASAA